jgi:hypothetical protein
MIHDINQTSYRHHHSNSIHAVENDVKIKNENICLPSLSKDRAVAKCNVFKTSLVAQCGTGILETGMYLL